MFPTSAWKPAAMATIILSLGERIAVAWKIKSATDTTRKREKKTNMKVFFIADIVKKRRETNELLTQLFILYTLCVQYVM